jgi:hypothetical protein
MSTEQREGFEQKMLEDVHFSEAVESAEFELIEEYADETLPSQEHQQLKTWVDSSAERRAQILIAQGLRRSAVGHRQVRLMKRLWWASAIAACLILAVSWSLLRAHRSLPTKVPVTNTTSTLPSIAANEDVILLVVERLRNRENNNRVTAYTIHPGARIRLQVILPSGYSEPTYSIRIHPSDGRSEPEVHFDGLMMEGEKGMTYLNVTLAPESLKPGMYVAEVRSPHGFYSRLFRVELAQSVH